MSCNCHCKPCCCECNKPYDCCGGCNNQTCGSNANANLRKCAGYGFDGPCNCACPKNCGCMRPEPRHEGCGCEPICRPEPRCGCDCDCGFQPPRPEPRRGGCGCEPICRPEPRCGCDCDCGFQPPRPEPRRGGCGFEPPFRPEPCCRPEPPFRPEPCCRPEPPCRPEPCCRPEPPCCGCGGCGCGGCDECGGCQRPNPCQGAINATADYVADCIASKIGHIAKECAEQAKNPCRPQPRCGGSKGNQTTWGRCH